MIIYNVTVKVDNEAHDEWLDWMRSTHIPDVMATGHFVHHQMAKVLVDDTDGVTYAIQYQCENMKNLEAYHEKDAPKLQKEHAEKFKDHFVAFRTLLELI
ncbi:MAG: DUF4286 family protein [Cryomorphaceae bacterium]